MVVDGPEVSAFEEDHMMVDTTSKKPLQNDIHDFLDLQSSMIGAKRSREEEIVSVKCEKESKPKKSKVEIVKPEEEMFKAGFFNKNIEVVVGDIYKDH